MTQQPDISQRRSSLLQKNIAASFLVKGWSALIVLMMVPMTLHCLGEYNNGVWLTISSVMLWIDNLDIGLGNGMRNKLATHLAHNDTIRARQLISSTFAMMTLIIIPAMLLLILLVMTCDIYGVLNVDASKTIDLEQTLIVTIILVCTTFVFKLIGNFYMGLQLPAVSNLLLSIGQTLALIGTYFIYKSGSHSLLYIAIVNTASPLLIYLLAYPYTFYFKYPELRPARRLVKLKEAREVIAIGIQFFILQLSSVMLFMTANIMISHYFSPSLVTPYQIAYRYFSLLLVVFTVICMPFWNATTDAYERGDINWIRQATKKLRLMTLGVVACAICMVEAADKVYALWIGHEVTIDTSMTIAMAIYILILVYSMRYSYFINGIGKLRLQLIITCTAAILFIPLTWFVVRWTDSIIGFMAVMCCINLPGLIANRIQFGKLVNGKAKGIWNQ